MAALLVVGAVYVAISMIGGLPDTVLGVFSIVSVAAWSVVA